MYSFVKFLSKSSPYYTIKQSVETEKETENRLSKLFTTFATDGQSTNSDRTHTEDVGQHAGVTSLR